MKKHILSKLSHLRSSQKLLSLSLLLLISFTTSCNTTEPINNQTLSLKLKDVSCTEAWVHFSSTNIQTPNNISLLVNGSVKKTFALSTKDSLLYIDSLLPNQTYKIVAAMHQSNNVSNELIVTTLDTTSNNFTWQTFTFGDAGAGSSTLYDVAIIDENNIWAVGEIYLLDSLGRPDPLPYNAVHWDGQSWELKRILYYGACSAVEYPPLRAIFAFSDNKILVTNGGSIGWIAGDFVQLDCRVNSLLAGAINKIWGSSSNDFYAVGNFGSIAHYQNGVWREVESGTDLWINDIYGSANPFNDKTEIISVAADFFQDRGVQVIAINENNTTEFMNNSGLIRFIGSVWFKPGIKYFIVGNGLYEKKNILQPRWVDLNYNRSITSNLMGCIRGNGLNNIIVVGAFGEVIHFNGLSWKSIKNAMTTLINGAYSRVSVKNNLIAVIGNDDRKAVTLLGRHL